MFDLLEPSERKGAVSWSLINNVWTAYWTVGITRRTGSWTRANETLWTLCYDTAVWFMSWPHTELLWIRYRFTAFVLLSHVTLCFSSPCLKANAMFGEKAPRYRYCYSQCNTKHTLLCWESASNMQLGEHWQRNCARFQSIKCMFKKRKKCLTGNPNPFFHYRLTETPKGIHKVTESILCRNLLSIQYIEDEREFDTNCSLRTLGNYVFILPTHFWLLIRRRSMRLGAVL